MINFNRYIKEALYEFDFFIVPGLGAFIASYTKAELDEEGELILPRKNFEFNGMLRKETDKKFIDFIFRYEKYSDSAILADLEAFLSEIRETLKTNKRVVIADVLSLKIADLDFFEGEFNTNESFYSKPSFDPKSMPIQKEKQAVFQGKIDSNEKNDEAGIQSISAENKRDEIKSASFSAKEQKPEMAEDPVEEYELEDDNKPWFKYLFIILLAGICFALVYYFIVLKP